jgi:hypothetical protein
MSNTLLTSTVITREALRVLHAKLGFISKINREYDDKEGQKRYSLEVRVNDLTLLGGKPADKQEAPQKSTPASSDPFSDFDSDLPF